MSVSNPTSPYLLHHMLDVRKANDHPAVLHGDASYSYAQLKSAVNRFAERLLARGIQTGDRVAIFLPKSFVECAVIFAVSKVGCVFVPINETLKPDQVRHIASDCDARAIITNYSMSEALGGALDSVRSLSSTLLVDDIDLDRDPALDFHSPDRLGEDLAAILYTSGSTGQPKGVMLSHRNLLAGTRIVRTYLGIKPPDRLLSILPFSFDYGLNQLLTVIDQGATLVLMKYRFGNDIVDALSHYSITGLAGVPTVWATLARAAPKLAKTELPKLRYITNSGGAVPSETVAQLLERMPNTQMFLMYGLTEAFRSTFLPPEEVDRRPSSMGKAIPECDVFALTEDGRRAGPGEIGILVHRGPTVSLGYWRRPEDTARVLRPNPLKKDEEGADIVCWSGDLVKMDEEGFFYFVGRADAMIKSAGYRISPTEVEEVLMEAGCFHQVAVIGLPDNWRGQKVHAVAVPVNSETETSVVIERASKKLPSYMVPERIELVAELPTTRNGKVDYKCLLAERST